MQYAARIVITTDLYKRPTSGSSYLYFPRQRVPLVLLLDDDLDDAQQPLHTPDVITDQGRGHLLLRIMMRDE